MQSNKHNSVVPPADQGGGSYFSDVPPGPFCGGMVLPPRVDPLGPFHGVEVQPSEACPKNFIIFDSTDNRSKIMFHHAIGSHMSYTTFTFGAPPFLDNIERNNAYSKEEKMPSFGKEDSEDIDVLLGLEAEDSEESDEEEVSTARTDANCGSSSPESCSNYVSHPKKCRLSNFKNSSASGSSSNGRKHRKMKKMVKALQGIIPGAGQMNTVAVLDEAVRYLKSLKMEVQKLGVGNLKSYI